MRRKHLESALSSLQRGFPDPKVELEQYPTSPHLAAAVLTYALERGDLSTNDNDDKVSSLLDLGCGTGMLAIAGALVLESIAANDVSIEVYGLDCDAYALQVAVDNAQQAQVDIEFMLAKIKPIDSGNRVSSNNKAQNKARMKNSPGGRKQRGAGHSGRGSTLHAREIILKQQQSNSTSDIDSTGNTSLVDGVPLQSNCVDVVVTNPPFGTKSSNAGMDMRFLQVACRLARKVVYSFHKTSTRKFILDTVRNQWQYAVVEVVAEMKFDLPNSYKFHSQKSVDVAVDLIRIQIDSHISSNVTDDSSTKVPHCDRADYKEDEAEQLSTLE